MQTYVRVREYGFAITEYDPERPWAVLSSEHRTIKLPDGLDFYAWAHGQWSAPHWSVELDPWQLSPRLAQDRPDDDHALDPGRSRPPGEDPSAGAPFRARGGAAGTAVALDLERAPHTG